MALVTFINLPPVTTAPSDLQHQAVHPACLPSCDNQFDHVFANGTGARCAL